MTNQAIQNAINAGYIVNINTGEIKLPKKLAYGKTSNQTQQQKPQQANTFSVSNLKNITKRVFGDRDFITGRTEQEEKEYQRLYNTPYSLEMDRGKPKTEVITYPDGFQEYRQVEGPDGRPVYTSKIGNLGLYGKHFDNKGGVCYKIKNDKGEIVSNCSETGNLITRALGVPTTDHAWFRRGVYGDSLIYGSQNHNRIYGRYPGKLIKSLTAEDINPNNLKSGDFVDLYTEGSGHNPEAAYGRGNSHTGTIFKPYENGPAYIIHNINSDVYVDPLSKFGPTHTWGIMGIRRPGSKEHPYYED